jgi:hypothetical protein
MGRAVTATKASAKPRGRGLAAGVRGAKTAGLACAALESGRVSLIPSLSSIDGGV